MDTHAHTHTRTHTHTHTHTHTQDYKIPEEERRISSLENSIVTRLTLKDVS